MMAGSRRRPALARPRGSSTRGGVHRAAGWWVISIALALVAGCGREEKPGPPAAAGAPAGPPTILELRIVPTPAYAAGILTAQARAADPQGQPAEVAYQWLRNGAEIAGATAQTLTPPAFKRGDEIAVQVTPRARGIQGPGVTSPAIAILNSPPVIMRLTVTPQAPGREETLKVSVDARDPDEDQLAFTYQWLRNGDPIPEATGPTLASGDLRKGDLVSVRVTASDGEARAGPRESPSVVVRNTPPKVLAGPQWRTGQDGVLLYQVAAADADGDPLTFSLSPDAPKGMTIDPKTGLLRWRPGAADVGTHRFSITVSDGDGGVVRQEVTTVTGPR